jgi:hypothetical protein
LVRERGGTLSGCAEGERRGTERVRGADHADERVQQTMRVCTEISLSAASCTARWNE